MTPTYKAALTELLYQLADDNFLLAYRGSEWLGLAPHIEEDVAFSSINQDMMGHATIYYKLLEELGEGEADALSHSREPEAFRNAVLLELRNGEGEYLEDPHYDWAFTVVRNYFYAVFKKVRLEALKETSYPPLAQAARKISTEHIYHLMHWETWFVQLMLSTSEARQRMTAAIDRVWLDFGGLWSYGHHGEAIISNGLLPSETQLKQNWQKRLQPILEKVDYPLIGEAGITNGDGRLGEHTEDLHHAINIFSEVYQSDPLATGW